MSSFWHYSAVNVQVFGIPGYIFCSILAFVLSACCFITILSRKKYPVEISVKWGLFSLLGLFIGARLFGCISGIYRAIGVREALTMNTIFHTGIVFYGGLIGYLTVFYVGIRKTEGRCEGLHVLDLAALVMPLFHGISRIGCFMAGCCYGRESDFPISIYYTVLINGTMDTRMRIPIQLIEAGFEIVLFLYLLILVKKENWKDQHILERYLFCYGMGRFFLEFFRGDEIRGIIHGISFSQVISIGIILWSINKKRKEQKKEVF